MDDYAENDLDPRRYRRGSALRPGPRAGARTGRPGRRRLTEGGDAVEDAAWDVQDLEPGVTGEGLVDDVAESLGYELP
jgi:hypothetical protein